MEAVAYFLLAVLAVGVCLLAIHAATFGPDEPLVSTTIAPDEPFELELETVGPKSHALWLTFHWDGPGDRLDRNDESTPPLEIEASVFTAPPGTDAAALRASVAAREAPTFQTFTWWSGANHGRMEQAEPGHWRSRTSVTKTSLVSRLKRVRVGSRFLIRGTVIVHPNHPSVPVHAPRGFLEHYVNFELFVTSPDRPRRG
jgi:hypothetical protein